MENLRCLDIPFGLRHPPSENTNMRVAVIGAGAAGLVAARELSRAQHEVTVYEQSPNIGGIWVYQEESESDPLGQSGTRLHASIYSSLRTNLPRDLMAFFDFPFDSSGGGSDNWLRYPGHAEVLSYLRSFAETFGISELICFNSKVRRVNPGDKWELSIDSKEGGRKEFFDAVVVCNGHYAAPRVPELTGMSEFSGFMMHSHNYRTQEFFRNKKVAVIGTAASGIDLTFEIASVAQSVHWCGNNQTMRREQTREMENIFVGGPVIALSSDGYLELDNDESIGPIECLIFATGYHYSFPFLSNELISVNDNLVTPLYQDLLCITEPTLALLGLPLKIIPFPIFDIQAKWFAKLLNKKFKVPPASTMRTLQEEHIDQLKTSGVAQRNYHVLDDQFLYYDRLALECGEPVLPSWYRRLGEAARKHAQSSPGSFRDDFLDVHGAPSRYPLGLRDH